MLNSCKKFILMWNIILQIFFLANWYFSSSFFNNITSGGMHECFNLVGWFLRRCFTGIYVTAVTFFIAKFFLCFLRSMYSSKIYVEMTNSKVLNSKRYCDVRTIFIWPCCVNNSFPLMIFRIFSLDVPFTKKVLIHLLTCILWRISNKITEYHVQRRIETAYFLPNMKNTAPHEPHTWYFEKSFDSACKENTKSDSEVNLMEMKVKTLKILFPWHYFCHKCNNIDREFWRDLSQDICFAWLYFSEVEFLSILQGSLIMMIYSSFTNVRIFLLKYMILRQRLLSADC